VHDWKVIVDIPRILLLIPSHTYRTADFLTAASALGIEVVVGCERRPALASLMEGRYLRLHFADVEQSVARIGEFAAEWPLQAVVAVDDAGTMVAAAASAALGLPHNAVAAVAASRDKERSRELFRAAGLPTPRFASYGADVNLARASSERHQTKRTTNIAPIRSASSSATSAGARGDQPDGSAWWMAPAQADALAWSRYPCVVKPVDLSGSRGVIRADDSDSFVEAFRRVSALVSSPEVCAPDAAPQRILVEDFIPGVEVAVEGLLRAGRLEVLAIFDKPDPLDGPYFEETIYVTPSRLPAGSQERIREAVRRATTALGLTEGPIHAELRLKDGPTVLEVAARSIGGLCARTLRFGAGVSLEELIVAHAAGLEIASVERERSAAGVMMLPIPTAGILEAVGGQEAARAVPGIIGLNVTIPLGSPLVPLPEGDRYLGFLFARGERPEEVEDALRHAHALLDVRMARERMEAV
jgi:biotin carboxylase